MSENPSRCAAPTDEDLVAWADGELGAADRARVEAHLKDCAPCRREAALLRESGELLRRMPGLAPRADFEARVVAAARETPATTHTAPRGRLVFLRPRVAAAAAVLLVGVSAGAVWLSSRGHDDELLTARDEDAIVEDLALLTNLDALQNADAKDLAQLVDDLDVIDSTPEGDPEKGG
jgi:anti-sigma factor RsiW